MFSANMVPEDALEAPRTLLISSRHDSRLPDLGARLETDELSKTQPARDPSRAGREPRHLDALFLLYTLYLYVTSITDYRLHDLGPEAAPGADAAG